MISLEEFVERVLKLGADRGPRGFPRGRRDREILMKSITLELDEKATYSEREVNEQLKRWLREIAPAIEIDHVALRRTLVDYGYLERTRNGSAYRVGFPPKAVAFDVEVYDANLRATVAAYLAEQDRRAAEKKARRAALTHHAAPESEES
ncbi:MAG: DUF2087 domain-containing protein [Deltaproteobacteria bacterium]|nr:DUF2087 domain-containing protein [Deltaproteobacteria bacterium]